MSEFRYVADAFEFCPRCAQRRANPGGNPFCCATCNFTYYFGPVVAVGGIVADQSGQVLMLRRASDPGRGKLGLPGGFADAGETLEDAVAREVHEEVRLRVTGLRYLISYPNSYSFGGITIPVTDAFFACQVESFETLEGQAGEVASCEFCHPTANELDNMAFESNRKALEFYLASA